MSRRIELQLTSTRDDGTWTWRAAGAKQPKGELDGSLLYDGAQVGDVVRADADFLLDGIVITAVLPPKEARKEPERLEVLGPTRRDDSGVTTSLAPRGRGERRGRNGRGRGERDQRRPRDGDRQRGERRERGPRTERPHQERPTAPAKPKPKRLKAGRAHRNAVLASLPEEQKPVAEQVLRGGIPAVRQAVDKQNEANRAEGKPEINTGPLLALAEELTPTLRTAEWHDRADAALTDIEELDLRDLRSVVVAADAAARDEQTRDLAARLRTALADRVDAEHVAWLTELGQLLDEGRSVRALRLSSRPPKAGAPFPAELAARLAESAAASLTADTGQERYATVLDALAHSPVRSQVTPRGRPAEPGQELLAAARKLAGRLPQIAESFGVEGPAPTSRPSRGRPRPNARRSAVPNPLGDRATRAAAPDAPAAPTEGGDDTGSPGPRDEVQAPDATGEPQGVAAESSTDAPPASGADGSGASDQASSPAPPASAEHDTGAGAGD